MQRRSESGLSTIEVLVMLVVLALAAGIAMQGLGAGVRRDVWRAQDGLSAEERRQGEATFRTLLQSGVAEPDRGSIEGDAQSLTFTAHLDRATLCTASTGPVRVTLRVSERQSGGGVLQCVSAGRSAVLAQWTSGRGAYAFGASGDWRPTVAARNELPAPMSAAPSGQGAPSLVRFTVEGDAKPLVWIERVPVAQALPSAPPTRRPDGGGDLDR